MKMVLGPELRRRWLSPATTLWLLAPVFGELLTGSAPLNEYLHPFTILIFGMLYGSGALLIRETLVRWKKGWASLLLLGAAYGLFEEGLVVRSFFDPHWSDLGVLGHYGRVGGVNWLWTQHLTVYHCVFSVTSSLAVVHMIFPDQRKKPWLAPTSLAKHAFLLAATLPIVAGLNPYNAPDIWLGLTWLAIVLLVILAWRICSPSTQSLSEQSIPRPRRFFWAGLLATFFHNVIVYVPAEKTLLPFPITMFLLAIFDLFTLRLILRWSHNARAWDDRHRLALIIGGLGFYLIFGPLTTNDQVSILYFTSPVYLIALTLFYKKVSHQIKASPTP